MKGGRLAATTGAALVALALAPAAQAANTFVDDDRPDNSGNCLMPATACKTIGGVDGGVAKAGANDTIFVESGTYAGQIILEGGRSLIAQDFIPGPPNSMPLIDGGASYGIGNNLSASGTVSGFRLNGDAGVVSVPHGITVTGNVIDEGTPSGGFSASVEFVNGGFGIGNYVFTNNIVSDPSPTDDQIAVYADGATNAQVTISDNTFNGFREAIDAKSATSTFVERNLITGAHQSPGLVPGFGIVASDTAATLTANRIQQPGAGPGAGIYVFDPVPAPLTSVTMARNQVFNFANGVQFDGIGGAVSMNGDLVANNTAYGLVTFSLVPTILASNVTAFDNGTDIALNDTSVSLNSSIVEDPIDDSFGTNTCMIDFSRGPLMMGGGNGCDDFDTTAAPAFVDPSSNNYHLMNGSPMIDAGSNVLTPPGTLDVDGDPRELDGNCDGLARRDIGADEAPCPPSPPTPPTVVPTPLPLGAVPSPPAAKKCKKGRKLKKGKCVKKKKKK